MNDGTEVAEVSKTEVAAPTMDPMAIWKSIEAMALNPDVDADKIGALLGYQTKIMDRAAQQAFTLAKNTAMINMPRITKNKSIVHAGKNGNADKIVGRYVEYEDLRKAVDPILTPLGIRLTHKPGFNDAMKMPTVTAVLSFVKDGMAWTEEGGEMVIPFDATGAKSGAQGAGSTLSYGYRYTTCAMLGIVVENEDFDGGNPTFDPMTLTPDEQSLVDQGQKSAANGTEALKEWFGGLSPTQRAALVYKQQYQKLNIAAKNNEPEV